MKSCLALGILGLAIPAWSQSYVYFSNTPGLSWRTQADRFVYLDQVGGVKLTGTNFVAGLWFVVGGDLSAVDGRIAPERGQQIGALANFRAGYSTLAGTWFFPNGGGPSVAMPVLPGTLTSMQVRVWDGTIYANFVEAFAAGDYGASAPFVFTVPQVPDLPADHYMDNFRAFAMQMSGRRVTVNDLVVAEGSNGVVQANFTFRLAQAQEEPLSFDYVTQDGTALAGSDYVATSGTVTFAPGEVTKIVSVTVTADAPAEDDEVFYLQLSNPVNCLLNKMRPSCTITEIRITGLSLDVAVSFNTVYGHHYILERTTGTLDWEPVVGGTDVTGTGQIVTIVDRGAGGQTMRVYRARLLSE